ncbi:MAG: hypothetical protein EOL87_16365 [Spartobacteria bacterium]|nr:hypothetical protein [Spartobacteria bacterium]
MKDEKQYFMALVRCREQTRTLNRSLQLLWSEMDAHRMSSHLLIRRLIETDRLTGRLVKELKWLRQHVDTEFTTHKYATAARNMLTETGDQLQQAMIAERELREYVKGSAEGGAFLKSE